MKRKERTERSGIIARRTVAVHETGTRNLLADKPGETAESGGRLFLFLFRHGEPPSRRILILNTIQILNMTFHFNEN